MQANQNILSERKKFELLINNGRYATVVKNQQYYNEIL